MLTGQKSLHRRRARSRSVLIRPFLRISATGSSIFDPSEKCPRTFVRARTPSQKRNQPPAVSRRSKVINCWFRAIKKPASFRRPRLCAKPGGISRSKRTLRA